MAPDGAALRYFPSSESSGSRNAAIFSSSAAKPVIVCVIVTKLEMPDPILSKMDRISNLCPSLPSMCRYYSRTHAERQG